MYVRVLSSPPCTCAHQNSILTYQRNNIYQYSNMLVFLHIYLFPFIQEFWSPSASDYSKNLSILICLGTTIFQFTNIYSILIYTGILEPIRLRLHAAARQRIAGIPTYQYTDISQYTNILVFKYLKYLQLQAQACQHVRIIRSWYPVAYSKILYQYTDE